MWCHLQALSRDCICSKHRSILLADTNNFCSKWVCVGRQNKLRPWMYANISTNCCLWKPLHELTTIYCRQWSCGARPPVLGRHKHEGSHTKSPLLSEYAERGSALHPEGKQHGIKDFTPATGLIYNLIFGELLDLTHVKRSRDDL